MYADTTIIRLIVVLSALAVASCASGQSGGADQQTPQREWIVLFPDQDWNDFAGEEIETFSGLLLYEAGDPLPSYVQRHNEYKLQMDEGGTLDIYLGSSDELEPLIGSRIEIRGCIVEMEVEGHCFIEIWPTEYRPAE